MMDALELTTNLRAQARTAPPPQNGTTQAQDSSAIRKRLEELLPGSAAKGRILVVDDEPSILTLMEAILTADGYEVVTEHNGYRAMVRASQEAFDLVYMDLKMPVNGIVAIKEILDAHPDLPIVIVTGFADEELIQQALSYGALKCMMKPFSLEQILEVTRQAIRKS